jgi:DNA-binding CsgD family transcriptional regulator
MPSDLTTPGLLGRDSEVASLQRMLAAARGGQSQALALRGDAGIGKTALLDHVVSKAPGFRLIRASGVEAESELAFAGLHQVCAPMMDRAGKLPAPQREALATAFGMDAGPPPSRFLVGLAVLGLFADAAASQPLLCVIDDAPWMDGASVQTMGFVARRLVAERAVCVFALRSQANVKELNGLPEMRLRGLGNRDARTLLSVAIAGRMDERIRDRVLDEARGNPLALLELPRGLTTADLGSATAVSARRSVPNRIEETYLQRVRSLPEQTQQLLLTAAAEPLGDPSLLRRAAALRGISPDAVGAAEAAGLIDVGTTVRFHHPLVRSAAYRAALAPDRQSAHRALADASDPGTDPDRMAWHRATAASGVEESVAAELESSAGRAQARGGVAAAAAFLARAVELTPDPAQRGVRALAAARAKYQAGDFDGSVELLDAAQLCPLTALQEARASLLRGQVLFAAQSAHAGLPLLIDAALQLRPLEPRLADETYRDAFYAALTAGRLPGNVLADIATAVRSSPAGAQPSYSNLLLRGLASVITDGYTTGAPVLRQALSGFRTEELSREDALGWLPLAARMAHDAWDFEAWSALSAQLVDLARDMGALSVLPSALLLRLSNRAFAGDLADAQSLVAEATAVGEATGSSFIAHYGALVLEARRGNEPAVMRTIDAITQDLVLQGEGKVLTATQWATAVLYNGLGRYEEARAAAERGCENPAELGLSIQSMVELAEASARLGRSAEAAASARTISDMALATGTDWALGTSARTQALVLNDQSAEALYREAIERLDDADVQMEAARARLVYGEWLRRENRIRDARRQLGAALDMFEQTGAEAFAERTRRELRATGADTPSRPVASPVNLTAQEAHIARLAGQGLTNSDIGAQLLVSAHTVEWHLRKVFAKLGIRSRRELRGLVLNAPSASLG